MSLVGEKIPPPGQSVYSPQRAALWRSAAGYQPFELVRPAPAADDYLLTTPLDPRPNDRFK
jgi:hypothetical protein